MLKNFQGDSWGLIPPLCMPSLLPHDLCHGWSSSRWLPAVIEFQLAIPDPERWCCVKCCTHYAICTQYAICRLPAVLLYSTGNYSQYLVISYNGKNMRKNIHTYTHTHIYTHIFIWATLLYTRNEHNIVNQLYFNRIKKMEVSPSLNLSLILWRILLKEVEQKCY